MGRMQVACVVASQRELTGDDRETGRRDTECARVVLSLAELADRIRTGCVYEGQPQESVGLLVTRARIRVSAGARGRCGRRFMPTGAPSRPVCRC